LSRFNLNQQLCPQKYFVIPIGRAPDSQIRVTGVRCTIAGQNGRKEIHFLCI